MAKEEVTETADVSVERSDDDALVKRPFLVLVIESLRPWAGGARFAIDGVDDVVLGRGPERAALRRVADGRKALEIAIPSANISSRHARISRAGLEWRIEDQGSRNGTFVNGERVTRARLKDGDVIEIGGAFFIFRPAWPTPLRAADDLDSENLGDIPQAFRSLVPTLAQKADGLVRIAKSNLSVLLLGETGTGKEVVARAVHEASQRRGPFVAVNCGALPAALVEGLLFGHKRGAFSGAVRDELGFFRAADGGTLFLDEIGDLALPAQVVLLRALQESEVVPLGETHPTRVDLRVISATHRPLRALSDQHVFRNDLLARLAGYTFEPPPLRARKEDIGLLVASFLKKSRANGSCTVKLRPAVARALLKHEWPMNIRELEQVITAGVQLSSGTVIEAAHLPASVSAEPAAPPDPPAPGGKLTGEELQRLLEEHRGNVAAVGRALAKAPLQVRRWMKEFGIDANAYRDKAD